MDIYVKGNLTRQDILKAFIRHLQPTRNSLSIRILLIAVVALILVFGFYQGTSNWWTILLGAVVLVGVAIPWWLPYLQALTFDKNSPLLKPLTGTLTDEGVSLRGNNFKSDIKWASYSYFKKSKDIILLYQGPNAFNFLARPLFRSDADWQECVSLVLKYLPSS